MSDREEATARVNKALDRGEVPADADLMICNIPALYRAQLDCRRRDPLTAAIVDLANPRRVKWEGT